MAKPDRLPTQEIEISQITEASKRVMVKGKVAGLNADDGSLSLDDGTGTTDAFFEEEVGKRLSDYKEGDEVVVIGWSREGGLQGEVVRRLGGNLNPELEAKVNSMWSEENVRS